MISRRHFMRGIAAVAAVLPFVPRREPALADVIYNIKPTDTPFVWPMVRKTWQDLLEVDYTVEG